jgi:GNAT superfamily N-acetyltransferase
MNDRIVEEHRGALLLSTDRSRIDISEVLALLLDSHWGGTSTRQIVERSVENSVCVGVYAGARQVAFARAVTDLATYAYWTDVIVASDHQKRGIGRWMVETLLAHPDLQGLRRIALWTRDAPELYARYGFSTDMPKSTYMELRGRK